MQSIPNERRKHIRRNVYIPVTFREIVNGKPAETTQVMCQDLSGSGLSFQSKTIYAIGTSFYSEIYLPNRSQAITAELTVSQIRISYGKNKYHIGCAFSKISEEDKNFISTSLDDLDIYNILTKASSVGASDIHLTVGRPPVVRIKGKLAQLEMDPLLDGQIKAMLYPLLSEVQIDHFDKFKNLDFAFSPTVSSRFRVNLHQQKGFMEAALRVVPAGSCTLEDLGLPAKSLENLCMEKSGLILIAGKTGAGKTTTLTSMVDFINTHMEKIVITVEDPIEYIHPNKKSVIKQRELGNDTLQYAETLRNALRQDSDVIVVAEILDGESLLAALKATETGHLVISTIHAPDTIRAIERMINLFPPEQTASVRSMICSSLLGILFQTLLTDSQGDLVPATELLINTTPIRNIIRDGKYSEAKFYFQTGSEAGMHTLESSLKRLFDQGRIDLGTMHNSQKIS